MLHFVGFTDMRLVFSKWVYWWNVRWCWLSLLAPTSHACMAPQHVEISNKIGTTFWSFTHRPDISPAGVSDFIISYDMWLRPTFLWSQSCIVNSTSESITVEALFSAVCASEGVIVSVWDRSTGWCETLREPFTIAHYWKIDILPAQHNIPR